MIDTVRQKKRGRETVRVRKTRKVIERDRGRETMREIMSKTDRGIGTMRE